MKRGVFSCFGILILSACSGNGGEVGETTPEMEKEIEAEAKSLAEAADEAVKALEEEIEEELADEGINAPAVQQSPAVEATGTDESDE